jgi:hypothetical protein
MGILQIIIIILKKPVGFYARKSPSLGGEEGFTMHKILLYELHWIFFLFFLLLSDKENSPGTPPPLQKKTEAGLEGIILLSNYTMG